MQAEAWAVIDSEGINVRSISPTERAAVVNWLCTEQKILTTVFVDDEDIDRMWERYRGKAIVAKVVVTAAV